jgi:tetratricopeptide (TPR) repeat protein/tRNA A-37 threonylcarbamoyl transferase component Bud32
MTSSSRSVSDETEDRTLVVGEATVDGDPAITPGTALGRYVVIDVLGRGGMGEVIHAYDPKLRREVALKRVRNDRLRESASNRLLREAHAMARLRHPNVVAVHDVEVHEGGLLLVMEYVDGSTLEAWLRQEDRPWQQVLRVFLAAGEGLAAAHRAGMVHRDVKPANVLVAADGRTQVTDFGIAKADDAVVEAISSGELPPLHPNDSLDELSSPLTEADRVVGTPRYMAPEQYKGTTTAASDQYSFCVALWEALCGAAPFSGGWTAMVAAKRAGAPSWPRGTGVPRRLAAAIARGLATKPEERWPSMDELLAELRHDTARKRRWWAAFGVASVAATIAVVTVGRGDDTCSGASERLAGVWDEEREGEIERAVLATQASYAAEVWARIGPELDAYANAWVTMHTDACEAATVRGEQSPTVMDLRMACLDGARRQLAASGKVLMEADAAVVARAHALVAGLPSVQRCGDLAALQADLAPPDDPELARRVEIVREQLADVEAHLRAGRYATAGDLIEALDADEATAAYPSLATEVELARGNVLNKLGDYAEAETALLGALRHAIAHGQWSEARAAAAELVYVVGYRAARPAEARAYAEIGWGLQERPGADWRSEVRLRGNSGAWLQGAGRYAEAEAEFRGALALLERWRGVDHPESATARSNLGAALNGQGREAEAEKEHRAVLATRIIALGEHHPDVASSRNNLGNALDAQGKHAEAEAEHRVVLALRGEALGPEHPDTAQAHGNLANALRAQGRLADADAEYRAALRGLIAAHGPDHPEVAALRSNLAMLLSDLGRHEEAENEQRAALATMTKAYGPVHPYVATVRNNLADMLKDRGRADEAEAEYTAALEILDAAGAEFDLVVQLVRWGRFLGTQGRGDEARAAFRRAEGIAAGLEQADALREEIARELATASERAGKQRG